MSERAHGTAFGSSERVVSRGELISVQLYSRRRGMHTVPKSGRDPMGVRCEHVAS